MEYNEAAAIIDYWIGVTMEAIRDDCQAVGMFIEDMNQIKNAYAVFSPSSYRGSPEHAKIKQFNGIDIFIQEVVDRERTGRV